MQHLTEIRIAGFGGQGVILSAIVIGKAGCIYEGGFSTMTQSFGPEARGGACSAQVILSNSPVLYPYVTKPDVLVVMSQEACMRFSPELKSGGILITEQELVRVDQIPTEGLLVPQGLVGPVRVDRIRIVTPRQRGQMRTARLAQAPGQHVRRQRRQVPHRAHPDVVEAFGGRRSDAPQRLHIVGMEELELVVRFDEIHAGAGLQPGAAGPRFGRPGRELGHHLGASDADAAVQTQIVSHPLA